MLQRSSDFPKNLRLHAVQGDSLYASKGNKIFKIATAEHFSKLFCKLTIDCSFRFRNMTKITQRFFRSGVHHIVCFKERLVIFVDKFIFTLNLHDATYLGSPLPYIGSRPLTVCNAGNERLYYGEYNGSRKNRNAGIFGSDDGIHWFEVLRISNIRHIHGVFFDPYTNAIWVTTGDVDLECGIWVTSDDFVHLDLVAGGTQQYRVIQLLFTKNFIYFGSDALNEENYIYRMERRTGRIETLQAVSGTVFWGCKVGDNIFFSTAVEPSTVGKNKYACIWGSPDGDTWKCIAKYKKDIWPMRLFQYGQIFFPAGENNTGYLFFTPFATEQHMTTNCINVKELFLDQNDI